MGDPRGGEPELAFYCVCPKEVGLLHFLMPSSLPLPAEGEGYESPNEQVKRVRGYFSPKYGVVTT